MPQSWQLLQEALTKKLNKMKDNVHPKEATKVKEFCFHDSKLQQVCSSPTSISSRARKEELKKKQNQNGLDICVVRKQNNRKTVLSVNFLTKVTRKEFSVKFAPKKTKKKTFVYFLSLGCEKYQCRSSSK